MNSLGMTTTDPMTYGDVAVWNWVTIVAGIIAIVATWIILEKAGIKGWGALIPIYNLYLVTKVSGNRGWFVILLLIPFVNIIATVFIALGLARVFGKSSVFAIVMLWLLTPSGLLVLAFGNAKYIGPDMATV